MPGTGGMESNCDVVITGLGVVSPIGIGKDAFWASFLEKRSGVRRLPVDLGGPYPPPFGGVVTGFEPKKYVPRKQMKVMSIDITLGFAAADLAVSDAGIKPGAVDPERFGVTYGADMIFAELPELVDAFRACAADGRFDFPSWGTKGIPSMFPLWMLKYLPNMPACHIAIALDARGPSNSLTMNDTSSLAAVSEAAQSIRRGQADVMVAGGASSRLNPCTWTRWQGNTFSRRCDDPAGACRPFDAGRDGMVFGEGAAALVLESAAHAQARGARPLAKLASVAAAFEPGASGQELRGDAIRRAIQEALRLANLEPAAVGHVNAHGVSTIVDDRIEARAIHDALGNVPVTAPKSFFGNLGAAGGAVEMVASVLAIEKGIIPPTLNYVRPDPDCPVRVVCEPTAGQAPALVLNHCATGQAMAAVLTAP